MRIRVVLLTNMITPYRVPVFNALAGYPEIHLSVIFLCERENNRKWAIYRDNIDFHYVVLRGWHSYSSRFEVALHLNPGLRSFLQQLSPDVVIIGGYSTPSEWMAWLWAQAKRIPIILWSGSTTLSTRSARGPIGLLRRIFIRGAQAYVTYGVKAAEFLILQGAVPECISIGCNVGDVEFYRDAVEKWRAKNLGSQEPKLNPQLLYVGRLISCKGLTELFRALRNILDLPWELTVVGDGPLRGRLEAFAARSLSERVKFVGFRQQEELVQYYAMHDVLMMPTLREVASIVISEALASGLFVVASRYDGSTYNLIQEPINGIIVDPKDEQEMVSKLRWAFTTRPWENRRNEIAASISQFTPQYYAEAFLGAIRRVINI